MTVGVLFRRAPIETVLPFEIAGQFRSGADLNIVIFFWRGGFSLPNVFMMGGKSERAAKTRIHEC